LAHHYIELVDAGRNDGSSALGNKHNRWHPAIPPAIHIASGDTVEMETRDAADGQIRKSLISEADLMNVNFGRVHALTGPIYIEDAEPGDLLRVDVLTIVTSDEGFTATLPGRGFIPDIFPGPLLTFWELADGFATSEQIHGVRIPTAAFMGTMGVAPSLERLRRVNKRERALADTGALVMQPMAAGALPADPAIFDEAWRTTAAHEVGGNMDIRQLVEGTSVYFPVDVPGALFSTGDGHFAQGDGETCGTAIETSTIFTARFTLLKGEASRRRQTNPSFTVPADRRSAPAEEIFATTALSVADDDSVSFLDANLAARNALIMMVDAIVFDYGLTRDQAYAVASIAGSLSISSIVNVPHAQVTMSIPRSIFTH
jgi:formamidase